MRMTVMIMAISGMGMIVDMHRSWRVTVSVGMIVYVHCFHGFL
jgi:hypothetical protein